MLKSLITAGALAALAPCAGAATTSTCLVISQSFEGFSRMRQDGYPFSDAEYMIKRTSSRKDVTTLMLAVARDAYQNPIYATDAERNAAVNMHSTTWLIDCLNSSSDTIRFK